jgi:hypothetical protein
VTFLGNGECAAADGNAAKIGVKPILGRPAGTKTVKVRAYRYVNRRWRIYKSYTATNADSGDYSKYSVKLSIGKKGKYRFRAVTSSTAQFAAASGPYSRTLLVK